MTNKELKRLSRADLLEMLINQTRENERLKRQISDLSEQLESRRIAIENTGSIAEASRQLNGVFESARAAAEQYLENIRNMESNCRRTEEETQAKCSAMLADADALATKIEQNAKDETAAYWAELSQRLEAFYAEHQGLKELMSVLTK